MGAIKYPLNLTRSIFFHVRSGERTYSSGASVETFVISAKTVESLFQTDSHTVLFVMYPNITVIIVVMAFLGLSINYIPAHNLTFVTITTTS